jgi:ketosteroid isomerase-like protein
VIRSLHPEIDRSRCRRALEAGQHEEGEMTADDGNDTAEAEIRALIDDQAKAIRAKDVDRSNLQLRAGCSVVRRRESVAEHGIGRCASAAEGVVRFVPGPHRLRASRPSVAAGDDVAFSHSLSRVSATTTDGRKLDMWWRTTVCYRKVDGARMVPRSTLKPIAFPDSDAFRWHDCIFGPTRPPS